MKTGIPNEWINGQKPHLIKDGIRIICNTENFVPIVVPGLSSSSSASSSTSRTPMKQESHSSSSSSSSPSSPTVDEKFGFEKEKMHLTVTSLQCQCLSWLMIDQGNLRKSKPTKIQKQIKRRWNGETRVVILRSRKGCKNSRKIWWMMKFHYRGGSHAMSSHEVSLVPTTKRREDLG